MKSYRVFWLGVVALVAGLGVYNARDSGPADSSPSPTKKLYWVQTMKGHPVHQMTQIAFKEGCKKLNYEPVIVGTDIADVEATISLAEQAQAGGEMAGMAIWTGDPSYNPLIEKFGKAGIPVILPHFPVPEGSVPGATGVISCDPSRYAAEVAVAIGKAIGGRGKVAITQGSFNTTENLVAATFKKTLAENYPGVQVLDPVEEGFDAPAAIAKAVSILQGNPDVVGALSTTGGGPNTWAKAQRDAHRKIVAIGMDYTRINLDLVQRGDVYAVVGQPLWEESYGAAELLDRAIHGEKIPWWTKLPAPLITKEELGPYYELLDKVEAAVR